DAGVFKSTDSGAIWLSVNDGLPLDHVAALTIDPTNSSMLYAGIANTAQGTGGVFKSTDAAITWTPLDAQLNTAVYALAVDPLTPTTVYAGTGTAGSGVFDIEQGAAPTCVGDCNGDGVVGIDEILQMVNIALGTLDVASCAAGDANDNG